VGGGLIVAELGGLAGEADSLRPPCPDTDSGGADHHGRREAAEEHPGFSLQARA
jgi:hypothetical protein